MPAGATASPCRFLVKVEGSGRRRTGWDMRNRDRIVHGPSRGPAPSNIPYSAEFAIFRPLAPSPRSRLLATMTPRRAGLLAFPPVRGFQAALLARGIDTIYRRRLSHRGRANSARGRWRLRPFWADRMTDEPDHLQVLSYYGDECQPREIEPLGSAGGFSGARFWRVSTDSGTLCLRRWPKESPTTEGLEFIQAVLWYVAREGFSLVPLPLENRRFGGYVRHGGHLWELAPWMPGEADFCRRPSRGKLRAAMVALAEFHRAAATFPLPAESLSQSPGHLRPAGPAPAVDVRRPGLPCRGHRAGDLAGDGRAGAENPGPFPAAARRVLGLLARSAQHEVELQPCIRDIWHDHVLYEGPRVSGLIDFGSMRPRTWPPMSRGCWAAWPATTKPSGT